jgi:uncharacterized protein (DUF362 family)
MKREGEVFVTSCGKFSESINLLLDRAGLQNVLTAKQNRVIIKPNLVENLAPPITTPVELVSTLVDYIKRIAPDVKIIIAEGCGAKEYDTNHVFNELGYSVMAHRKGVELVDLNEAPLIKLSNKSCRRWPEMYLPEIVFDSFLISVPVLKAHSLASVTLTMKNMMGLAPPKHYQQGGHWKKASFHSDIHAAVYDLNQYRTPDFTLLDATVGMQEAHLWGPTCNPPPGLLAAGFDPVAIDSYGAGVLKRDWRNIGHLKMAHKKLGIADPLEIIYL